MKRTLQYVCEYMCVSGATPEDVLAEALPLVERLVNSIKQNSDRRFAEVVVQMRFCHRGAGKQRSCSGAGLHPAQPG